MIALVNSRPIKYAGYSTTIRRQPSNHYQYFLCGKNFKTNYKCCLFGGEPVSFSELIFARKFPFEKTRHSIFFLAQNESEYNEKRERQPKKIKWEKKKPEIQKKK